nr:hotdog domain-containing protein [Rhabdothermincola salaria]
MSETPDPDAPDGPPVVTAECALPDHLLEGGHLSSGVLATLVDNVGGMVSGLAALPDWVVTTNLSLRRAPASGATRGPLAVTARLMRRGRTSVVARIHVDDREGRSVATAWMTSSILVPDGGPPPVPRPLRPHRPPTVDHPLYRSAPSAFFALEGGEHPGEVRIDAPPRLRNPWGIVHGGALAVAVDAAARAAVAHPTGTDTSPERLVVSDLVVHYLSPGRVGPIVAGGELVGSRRGDHLVRVTVADRGADDRPLVLAVATVGTR